MYVWGFLFWGVSTLGYIAWKGAPNDESAQKALFEQFPESGTYYVPAMSHDPKTLEGLFAKGPVAFVHLIREGRPLADASIMGSGFVLYLAVAILMAVILQRSGPRPSTYGARLIHLLLIGIFAALLIDVGDAVWWKIPWGWKLTQGGYNIAAIAVGGSVLAHFIRPEPAGEGDRA
jgi:hypothetical protein